MFFFFFFHFLFHLQVLRLCETLWDMTDYRYLYVHTLAWLYALLFCSFMLYLAAIIALIATFGLAPPEFTQAALQLLGRSFAPILAPFLLPLLSLLRLSFTKISVAVLPLFHFLISWLTIFSHFGLAVILLLFLVL